MRFHRGIRATLTVAALSLLATGCMRKVLLDGNVRNTRRASDAINTLHDYEVAEQMARTGIATIEGLHKLVPYNEDALFMLTRSWVGTTYAFTEDEYEEARLTANDVEIRYHLGRTIAGYDRARFFGIELLSGRASGFQKATRNYFSMQAWLRENFTHPDEAEDLLWVGSSWLNRVSAGREPASIGEMYVGVAIVQRSVELDETHEYGMGHTILGAYHARTAQSELEESKEHFDRALEINGGKLLQTKFLLATRYYCAKADKANYEKLLQEVIEAEDPLPERRLGNAVAKRRARRYLTHAIFQEDCGFAGAG